jgi:cytochrome c biogenesis protein
MGEVTLGYVKPIPVTGLQYKSDPGLPITYTAFGIIMLGVMMAAFPHRQVWACSVEAEGGGCKLYTAGISKKAKSTFNRSLEKLMTRLKEKFGEIIANKSEEAPNMLDNDKQTSATTTTTV